MRFSDPQGLSVPPPVLQEGGIIVNTLGRRFVDETEDIAGMVHPVLAQPGGHCWVVFDEGIEARCAHIPETRELIALNAARVADDEAGLASRIGVMPEALMATLKEARAAQSAGRTDAFGRNWGEDHPPSGSCVHSRSSARSIILKAGCRSMAKHAWCAPMVHGFPICSRVGARRAGSRSLRLGAIFLR